VIRTALCADVCLGDLLLDTRRTHERLTLQLNRPRPEELSSMFRVAILLNPRNPLIGWMFQGDEAWVAGAASEVLF